MTNTISVQLLRGQIKTVSRMVEVDDTPPSDMEDLMGVLHLLEDLYDQLVDYQEAIYFPDITRGQKTPDIWYCKCPNNFIHPYRFESCLMCGALRDEQLSTQKG